MTTAKPRNSAGNSGENLGGKGVTRLHTTALQILALLAVPTRQSLIDGHFLRHSRFSSVGVGPGARLGWRSILKLSNGVEPALVIQNNSPQTMERCNRSQASISGTSGRQSGDDYSLPRPVPFQCFPPRHAPQFSGTMDPAAAWSGLLCRATPRPAAAPPSAEYNRVLGNNRNEEDSGFAFSGPPWRPLAAFLPGRHRAQPRREDQQHLAGGRRGLDLPAGLSVSTRTSIARRVLALDNRRATPAERLRDGHDFEPTNKWILFGHHFAAIAGPGPLVGPVLAAQFGYLPGALWIVVGAVLGGAAQDFIVLFASMRRDGKSLGEMAREEIGKVGGFAALLTVLLIMVIMLAVMALVVVNALQAAPGEPSPSPPPCPSPSSWALPPLLAARPVLECSLIGSAGGGVDRGRPGRVAVPVAGAPVHALRPTLALAVVVYGFLASALPVWLLLAPRDYLSTFVKLGVVLMLGVGVLFVRPELQLPAFTRFKPTAPGRSSRARSSPSASSPSPAAPSPASTR